MGIREYPARRMPRFEPSAWSKACPRVMPTSSTVWCFDLQVAVRLEIEVEATVTQRVQHVIEKINSCRDAIFTADRRC